MEVFDTDLPALASRGADAASGLRICLIASSRFPVAEPFAGGLEAHTASLARALIERGHTVALFAAEGSDPQLNVETLAVAPFTPSDAARLDVGASPAHWMQEHHAYLSLMLALADSGHDRFDVIHNNSLHHLPVAMAPALKVPVVTTLHTPPTPWLESAMRVTETTSTFVAVSAFTAGQWDDSVTAGVILNGIDVDRWRPGPGGDAAVWFGRLVPEKAPHLAIEAAEHAGMALDLSGPIFDRAYFEAEIAPRLNDRIRYVGHLDSAHLSELIRHAAVAVVTPQWDEPYGLVAAEAMACGTPVAAFARGGLPEVVGPDSGRLARAGDTAALGAAMIEAAGLSRQRTREWAERHCSLAAMVDAYEQLYYGVREARAA